MKVIVTTGPSFEPIDQVRRLTNFSTGQLGVSLANRLAAEGFEVFCLRGVGATGPTPAPKVHLLPFTTNEDLHEQLASLSQSQTTHAFFHVAALSDFKVAKVTDAAGHDAASAKIDSWTGAVILHLVPARKILRELRSLFPGSLLVGWKYELVGSRGEALAKAWSQIREHGTDACVLNGLAYGSGFAFCAPPERVQELADQGALVEFLCRWLKDRTTKGPGTDSHQSHQAD